MNTLRQMQELQNLLGPSYEFNTITTPMHCWTPRMLLSPKPVCGISFIWRWSCHSSLTSGNTAGWTSLQRLRKMTIKKPRHEREFFWYIPHQLSPMTPYPASTRNCGIWVVFPEPVSPSTTTVWLFFTCTRVSCATPYAKRLHSYMFLQTWKHPSGPGYCSIWNFLATGNNHHTSTRNSWNMGNCAEGHMAAFKLVPSPSALPEIGAPAAFSSSPVYRSTDGRTVCRPIRISRPGNAGLTRSRGQNHAVLL